MARSTGRPGRPSATVSQLRNDIDSGRTGDKVEVSDPATAPLGTDSEAAGAPPSGEEVAVARALERRPHLQSSARKPAGFFTGLPPLRARPIPTRVHGILDYVIGAILIASPFVLGFATGGPEQWLPILLGAAVIAYSLATDYELGLLRVLPMPAHLALDGAGGLLLLVSPSAFLFAEMVLWPHVTLGLVQLAVAFVSQTVAKDGRLVARRA